MSQNRYSEVRTSQQESGQERRVFAFKLTQWVWLGLGIVETLIGLRVVLKLIAANPGSPFAAFIYNISDVFLFPFSGLVATPAAGGMVLEISSIIAMLVFALLAWGIERIVWVSFYRPRTSAVGVTQTTTSEQISDQEEETTL